MEEQEIALIQSLARTAFQQYRTGDGKVEPRAIWAKHGVLYSVNPTPDFDGGFRLEVCVPKKRIEVAISQSKDKA